MQARGAVKRLSSPCRRITRASERRRDMCASPCAAAVANITATFDDVKDISLRPLPKSDASPSFAASTLWREKPCVIVVMRRPG